MRLLAVFAVVAIALVTIALIVAIVKRNRRRNAELEQHKKLALRAGTWRTRTEPGGGWVRVRVEKVAIWKGQEVVVEEDREGSGAVSLGSADWRGELEKLRRQAEDRVQTLTEVDWRWTS